MEKDKVFRSTGIDHSDFRAFKTACAKNGESMTNAFRRFIKEYSKKNTWR